MNDYMNKATQNLTIYDSFVKAESVLSQYDRVACSVSGGADSDVMIDLLTKIDHDKKVKYVWFNTGLEYQATKNHLEYLENRYDITIERERAVKSIPLSCKEYGQPFLSKFVSQFIEALQKHGFQWEDEPYEVLKDKYPKAKSYIGWWCNQRDTKSYGYSQFNINYYKNLKDFLISNPPYFRISSKCCHYAKKEVSKKYAVENNIQLMILGIRKAEGGIRGTAYKSCFLKDKVNPFDKYMPIFWYKNEDKSTYERLYTIVHSDCYKRYGLQRTGCIGCPFNKNVIEEMEIIKNYEPKLVIGANNVFKDSYEYTKQYREFCKERK